MLRMCNAFLQHGRICFIYTNVTKYKIPEYHAFYNSDNFGTRFAVLNKLERVRYVLLLNNP